ncbi:DUF5753 domain-containing protein [Kitasatospora sp. MAP5-34]|uniref:DUF5753 domain-containing protein n=1 Tax=Kitasatospora sp. MAP5-34 TaxID=3035102 RepID=UPI0024736917|nr:DUF5753 domain-containing protein [Kitasatospora sp. MAP5-34]MDH6578236.1 hypothetical protein [Kitasatospora sp. MAP5-34]
MVTASSSADSTWDDLLQQGTGPVQESFLDLARNTRHYVGYQPDIVWGNLQTPQYAEAMLRLVVDFHGIPDDIEAGVAARTARAQFIGQEGRTYHVLLGEQALLTNIGGPEVMRGQLHRLIDALSLPGLTLGIVPARARLLVYPGDGFSIFDDRRVEVEGFRGGETITDPDRLAIFRKAFDRIRPSAVYGPAARDLIETALSGT